MKICLPLASPFFLTAFGLGVVCFSSCATRSSKFPLTEDSTHFEETDSGSWLAYARVAESRLDWAKAGLWMDRYAELSEAALDEGFWFHRAALAEKAGDPYRSAEVRENLLRQRPEDVWLRIDLADDLQQIGRAPEALQILDISLANPEDQALAGAAAVELLQYMGRILDAAERCESLAMNTPDAQSKGWWHRASGLYEQAGDLRRATICMQRALSGMDLGAEEKRVIQRLEAFELGRPQNVADALLLVQYHADPEMRLQGLRYLGRERFPNDVGVFEFALQDPSVPIICLALEQLALRAEKGHEAPILPLLGHSEPAVVLSALRSLKTLGTEADLPLLIPLMLPDNRSQFLAARQTVEAISGHSIDLSLDPNLQERINIRQAWLDWWEAQEAAKLGG